MNPTLNLLGLAQRAGKLVSGEETVIKNIRQKNTKVVLVCLDASENTKKKISDKCQFYQVKYLEAFTSDELSHALGKKRYVCGITEGGFAKKIIELIEK